MEKKELISLSDSDITYLIENKSKDFIVSKFRNLQLLSEIDFQFKILQFIESEIERNNDMRWNIHNCYYLKECKRYPDLVLFKNKNPHSFLELKFYDFNKPDLKAIKKDIKKLIDFLNKYPSLNTCYSITLFHSTRIQTNAIKSKLSYDDKRIKVLLWNIADYKKLDDFEEEFKQYKITLGRNLKKRKI